MFTDLQTLPRSKVSVTDYSLNLTPRCVHMSVSVVTSLHTGVQFIPRCADDICWAEDAKSWWLAVCIVTTTDPQTRWRQPVISSSEIDHGVGYGPVSCGGGVCSDIIIDMRVLKFIVKCCALWYHFVWLPLYHRHLLWDDLSCLHSGSSSIRVF